MSNDRTQNNHRARYDRYRNIRRMKLGKTNGVLKGMYFTVNGIKFQIISTLSTGRKSFDAVDTVKNLSNGKYSDIKRVNLCDMDVDSIELTKL